MVTKKRDKKTEEAIKRADKAIKELYFSITGKKWKKL
jgi:hypothetical protein